MIGIKAVKSVASTYILCVGSLIAFVLLMRVLLFMLPYLFILFMLILGSIMVPAIWVADLIGLKPL